MENSNILLTLSASILIILALLSYFYPNEHFNVFDIADPIKFKAEDVIERENKCWYLHNTSEWLDCMYGSKF
jgi:hypothetical protein